MKGFLALTSLYCLFLNFAPGARGETAPVDQPRLSYSTYLGGQAYESAIDIAVDSAGSAYVLGTTISTNFPKGDPSLRSRTTFVSKMNPAGDAVVFTKLLPNCVGRSIAVNASGEAVIAGDTFWNEFPITSNALQTNFMGETDGFVLVLSANGAEILYSTFFGGAGDDFASSVALDNSGNIYLAGFTSSTDLPLANAVQTSLAGEFDGFVLKFNRSANSPIFSTYFGGGESDQCFGVATDQSGNVYVAGRTSSEDFPTLRPLFAQAGGISAFAAKFSSTGGLLFSSYLGGGGTDSGSSIAVDQDGNFSVLGVTSSTNFPLRNAFQSNLAGELDNFIARFSADGSQLIFSTYLGGGLTEGNVDIYDFFAEGIQTDLSGVAVDPAGFTYVASSTSSGISFPTRNSLKTNPEYYSHDAYVAKFDPAGALVFSTLLGGSGPDVGRSLALDLNTNIYLIGRTTFNRLPTEFPTTEGAFQGQLSGPFVTGYEPYDVFVSKLTQQQSPASNDNFSNRTMMNGTRWTTLGDNFNAAKEPGEPNHAGNSGGKSVWWSWTAPVTGRAWITTLGSSFDTILAVYTGSTVGGLVPVASEDDPSSTNSSVKFPIQLGQTYHIAVDGSAGVVGNITLTLNLSLPVNDDFANRILLEGLNVRTNGSNLEGTAENVENFSYSSGRSVWYSWKAPANGLFAVEASRENFRGFIYVFTGSALDDLQLEAGNFYSGRSVLRAIAGTSYEILVDGIDGSSGPFNLTLAPASPPANDNFESRAELTSSLVITNVSNFDSTPEQNDPNLQALFDIFYARGSTVWWRWVAPTNGTIVLQATATNFSPFLTIYTGSSLTNLVPVPVASRTSTDLKTVLLITNIVQGVAYQIMVDEVVWQDPGTFELALSVILPPRFERSTLSAGREFAATAQAVIGRNYRIESSANLIQWIALTNLTAINGSFSFRDPAATDRIRFYRAVEME